MKNIKKLFEKGGILNFLFPLYEAIDTFLLTPKTVTKGKVHIRKANDLKRIMTNVVYALIPATLFGIYNIGYQASLIVENKGYEILNQNWQGKIYLYLNLGDFNIINCFLYGLLFFLPIYIVTLMAGGFWEVLFACVRKHEINEGFFVTSLLFPLILPPSIPLWQVALGISFGVVIAKEIFGGVGMNFINPALASRAFLFFAYPASISGSFVWTSLDSVSCATPLSLIVKGKILNNSWWDSFFGFIPGSIGETSTLAILLGAIFLLITGVACWRIMVSVILGMTLLSFLMPFISDNYISTYPFYWHFVLGGFAFGTVFMTTDPVTASVTKKGKYVYGLLIGSLTIIIRVINPAYPEGMMLAILFGNIMAPLIDKLFINSIYKKKEIYGR